MQALLLALYVLNGRATAGVLQVVLEHSTSKTTYELIARAAAEGLTTRPGAGARGAEVELTEAGRQSLVQRLHHPLVWARLQAAHAERQARRAG